MENDVMELSTPDFGLLLWTVLSLAILIAILFIVYKLYRFLLRKLND